MGQRKRLSHFFSPSRSVSADAERIPLPQPPVNHLKVVEALPTSPALTTAPTTLPVRPRGNRKLSKDRRDQLRGSDDDFSGPRHSLTALPTDPARTTSINSPDQFAINDEVLPLPPSLVGGSHLLGSPLNSNPTTPASSRPSTPQSNPLFKHPMGTMSDTKLHKRKSWFPGSAGKTNKWKSESAISPPAWISGQEGRIPYTGLNALLKSEKVDELWLPEGDAYVYLFPATSNKGPAFKVDSEVFQASALLTKLALEATHGISVKSSGDGYSPQDTTANGVMTPHSSVPSRNGSNGSSSSWPIPEPVTQELHLYLPLELSTNGLAPSAAGFEPPLASGDVELLMAVRNMFAFLTGQSLVATEKHPNMFSIFMRVAEMLKTFGYTNMDGTTFGECANESFNSYIEELDLDTVKTNPLKTMEAVILGERMRSSKLYNEGYVHAVGQYREILDFGGSKFSLISSTSQNRLERSYMDLGSRITNVDVRLVDFNFPSIFAGILNSKAASERKFIKFDQWKTSFLEMRRHVLAYYRKVYGSWPPKPNMKKNELETGGLNRLVLKNVYRDFTALYDLLVDRTELTTRNPDSLHVTEEEEAALNLDPMTRALRRVLGEFDHSTPPVLPPIPFDMPNLPTLATTNVAFGKGSAKKDSKMRERKIKDDEINKILRGSYNDDAFMPNPFLVAFYELERRTAHNKNIEEIVNNRVGQWIFIYVVLQSLPMLVMDAPEVTHTTGVEYFLCQVPRSGVPWGREDFGAPGRNWYGITGSSGVVNLPSDVVEHGVEGIFRRSHCWQMAKKWTEGNAILSAAIDPQNQSLAANPLPAPPGFQHRVQSVGAFSAPPGVAPGNGNVIGSRPQSRGASPSRQSVVALGLEQLPVPTATAPGLPRGRARASVAASRPKSTYNAAITFDDILGPPEPQPMTKAERRRTRKLTG